MAAVASGYFLICLNRDGWEDAVAGVSPVRPFSAENNVPRVSSVV